MQKTNICQTTYRRYFDILTGPVDLHSTHTSFLLTTVENRDIKQNLMRFWELESTVIREDANPIISKDEENSYICGQKLI